LFSSNLGHFTELSIYWRWRNQHRSLLTNRYRCKLHPTVSVSVINISSCDAITVNEIMHTGFTGDNLWRLSRWFSLVCYAFFTWLSWRALSVRSQKISWKEHLHNVLLCVEWDVKPFNQSVMEGISNRH